MAHIVTGGADLKYDSLAVVPLGGQSEHGQVLWAFIYAGEILLIDAGAAYPTSDLPGVDLLLPNTNFLEANQERILALVLTNAHEEHCGAVSYLLHHLTIPRIMGPRFVAAFLAQCAIGGQPDKGFACPTVDTIELRHAYSIGPFDVEWIQMNDAIADACALRIGTPEGTIVYTSSFKFDQTPVDKRLADIARLAQTGDSGVQLLISDSSGAEVPGYTPSERSVEEGLYRSIRRAIGRVIVVLPGTNTHRLQIIFDIAKKTGRKIVVIGETLIRTTLSAAITGNLTYDRRIEASVESLLTLHDSEVLVVATGLEGDPMDVLGELANGRNKDMQVKEGDTIIYSAEIYPGRLRQMATFLDQFLSLRVRTIYGPRANVHVSKHASREELKLMLSIINPRLFIPSLGEGRHIMHHAQLAGEWGMPPDTVFPLKNGEILQIDNGIGEIIGSIEASAVLFNRDQGERVTTFSVNERRNLSTEGIVSIGLVVDGRGKLISGPVIEVGASGFMLSSEWQYCRPELDKAIVETVERVASSAAGDDSGYDFAALRAAVREISIKTLRSKLQSKPTVQVIVQELATTPLQ
ncbi:MAG TPA: ribonuclease J [Trichormus sp.]